MNRPTDRHNDVKTYKKWTDKDRQIGRQTDQQAASEIQIDRHTDTDGHE
jgi:hypothetical protein